jgi:hypothetical protein
MYVVKLNKAEEGVGHPKPRARYRWTKSPMGKLKLNHDASFSPIFRSGGWGFVIKDADGEVVNTGWGRVKFLRDAF